jgi:hypothetical protein
LTAQDLRLPGWAHRPGRTRAADRAPLDAAKRLVPPHFRTAVPADHPAFRYGLILHDSGFFWEAHEVWEAVWMAAPLNGRDRLALRALIQIANAALKRCLGQPNACDRLRREAIAVLEDLEARLPQPSPGSLADSFAAGRLARDLGGLSGAAADPAEAPLLLLRPRFADPREPAD